MAVEAPEQKRLKMNFDEMRTSHCSVLPVTEIETMFVFRQIQDA